MAQLVEHILGKDEVPSSNLGSSSKQRSAFVRKRIFVRMNHEMNRMLSEEFLLPVIQRTPPVRIAQEGFALALGLLNAEVQHEGQARERKEQNEGSGISAAGGEQGGACRCNEGCRHQIEGANAEVCGKVLLAVKRGDEGGCDRGGCAIGQAGEAETDDQNDE